MPDAFRFGGLKLAVALLAISLGIFKACLFAAGLLHAFTDVGLCGNEDAEHDYGTA